MHATALGLQYPKTDIFRQLFILSQCKKVLDSVNFYLILFLSATYKVRAILAQIIGLSKP
ncbi:hypothetical protein PE36_06347 [Moritella sp. PE36]|nr:hypothetical protein PE36_06347 [Moritella sp. PE36]